MKPVIKVEELSKMYRLGQVGTGSIAHDVNRWWHRVRGKEDPYLRIGETNDRTKKGSSDYVWALKDINFEVKPGEVLGIIGRNGAGKSTLLKILSRTTAPTTGSVKIKGRVASLLEVGTGFHPDLSGRDNIFLNGAILGMTRREIQSKFDEIVDFAGVERYIDTPVKRYSSGMYVRLAFAVAAHLEPEILIVDEVLAVGDAEFQKKCLGKMKDVSDRQGRTVLFVSHNLDSIQMLCEKILFLKNGTVEDFGATVPVIDKYLDESKPENGMFVDDGLYPNPNFSSVKVITSDTERHLHLSGDEMTVEVEINMPHIMYGMAVSMQIINEKNIPCVFAYIFDVNEPILRNTGKNKLICRFPSLKLYKGKYFLKMHLAESKGKIKFQEVDRICPFEVVMDKKPIEWGWQDNVCIYDERFEWSH